MMANVPKIFCTASLIGFSLFVASSDAYAAEAECSNVKDSAVTHYSSSKTASITEDGRDCTISIGGANAASRTPGPIYILSGCAAIVPLDDIPSHMNGSHSAFARAVIPVLAGASVPGFDVQDRLGIGGFPDLDKDFCEDVFGNIDENTFDSPLHAEMKKKDGLFDQIEECLEDGNGGSDVDCSQDGPRLIVRFQSSRGMHSVFLPRP